MSHAIPVNLCTLFLVDSMHDTHETEGQHLELDTAEAQCSRNGDDEFPQHACGQFLFASAADSNSKFPRTERHKRIRDHALKNFSTESSCKTCFVSILVLIIASSSANRRCSFCVSISSPQKTWTHLFLEKICAPTSALPSALDTRLSSPPSSFSPGSPSSRSYNPSAFGSATRRCTTKVSRLPAVATTNTESH